MLRFRNGVLHMVLDKVMPFIKSPAQVAIPQMCLQACYDLVK